MPQRSSIAIIVIALAAPALLLGLLFAVVLLDDSDSASAACLDDPVEVALPEDWPDDVAGFTGAQLVNAGHIIAVAADRDLSTRAATIALMTAITESGLRNLANAGEFTPPPGSRWAQEWPSWRQVAMLSLDYPNDGVAPGDWDSIGLFQQRPSQGWGGDGTPEQQVQNLLNPEYAAAAFYDALLTVNGWEQLPLGAAAQTVQRSAFPDAYDDKVGDATALLDALSTASLDDLPGTGTLGCGLAAYDGTVSTDGWAQPVIGSTYTSAFGTIRAGYTHMGSDFAAPAGTPIFAAADGVVAHVSCSAWRGRSPCNILIDHGLNADDQRVQTLYVHMYPNGVHVDVGDRVSAGDHIADVGSNGNSTGPHLHLEVWIDEQPIDAVPFLAGVGITM